MLSGSCNRYTIQNFKEIKIQSSQKSICGSIFRIQFAPCIKCLLSLPEDILQRFTCIKFAVKILSIAFICNCQLVSQIHKSIINRCSRKHQDFRLNAWTDYFIHQFHISIFHSVGMCTSTITEIVWFVDNNQIIIAPIQPIQVKSVWKSTITR